jgi:hypothetical protein
MKKLLAPVCALGAALALAGCGGGGGDPSAPTGSRLANMLAFGTPDPGPAPRAADPNALKMRSCPSVEILDGGASLRVGGASSDSVRHQFSITDVARQCDQQGAQIAMKVGVEGFLVIGPAGSNGTYSAGVKVAVREEKTEKIILSKSYRVSATAAGAGNAPFTLVTDSFAVPLINEDAASDYSIIVSFEGVHAPARASRTRRRR